MVEEEMYLFLCPIISVSSGVANIGKKEGEMTIEEIEKYVDGRKKVFPDSKECNMFEFLLSEVKRLREGIKIAILNHHFRRGYNQPTYIVSDFDEKLFEELYKLLEDK